MATATLEKPAKKLTMAQKMAKPDVYDLEAQDFTLLRNNAVGTNDRVLMEFYYGHRHSRPEVKLGFALNGNTPTEWLAEIARTEDVAVRRAVASHDHTDEATLRYLADDSQHIDLDYNARVENAAAYSSLTLAVAGNPVCPVTLLEELSTHKWWAVRYAAAKNLNTPVPVLLRLAAKDAKTAVRKQALAREASIRAHLRANHPELVNLPLKEAATALHLKRTRTGTSSHKTA